MLHNASGALRGLMLVAVVTCALSVVTAQHKARKLLNELQNEKESAQQMEVEWGQLQLEQGTLGSSARVERIASKQLHMHLPKTGQSIVIRIGQPAAEFSSGNTGKVMHNPKAQIDNGANPHHELRG